MFFFFVGVNNFHLQTQGINVTITNQEPTSNVNKRLNESLE